MASSFKKTNDPTEALFQIDEQLRSSGMAPLSDDELGQLLQKVKQASAGRGLAPVETGVPIAGFQGSSAFPNQVGSGLMPRSQLGKGLMPPIGGERLDASGQPFQSQGFLLPGQSRQGPTQSLANLDFTIQGGQGGVRSILLKMPNQKETQRGRQG